MSGSALAPVAAGIAEAAREQQQHLASVRAELAGPRASARMLAGLPAVGLALGAALGGGPGAAAADHTGWPRVPVGRRPAGAGRAALDGRAGGSRRARRVRPDGAGGLAIGVACLAGSGWLSMSPSAAVGTVRRRLSRVAVPAGGAAEHRDPGAVGCATGRGPTTCRCSRICSPRRSEPGAASVSRWPRCAAPSPGS